MSDCEFCNLPLEEHDRTDAPGTWIDGLLIHRFVVSEEAWNWLQERLDDDRP